ncbi:peroxin [Trifolium repens]|nr:peroxin [Trifolium repens]
MQNQIVRSTNQILPTSPPSTVFRALFVVLFCLGVRKAVVVVFSAPSEGWRWFCFRRRWWWFLSASFRLVFVFTIEVKLHNSVAGTYGLPPTPARRALFIVYQSAILYIAKRISSRIASWGIILAGYEYAEFMFQFVVKLWRVYLVLLFVCEHKFRYHGNNHV